MVLSITLVLTTFCNANLGKRVTQTLFPWRLLLPPSRTPGLVCETMTLHTEISLINTLYCSQRGLRRCAFLKRLHRNCPRTWKRCTSNTLTLGEPCHCSLSDRHPPEAYQDNWIIALTPTQSIYMYYTICWQWQRCKCVQSPLSILPNDISIRSISLLTTYSMSECLQSWLYFIDID